MNFYMDKKMENEKNYNKLIFEREYLFGYRRKEKNMLMED